MVDEAKSKSKILEEIRDDIGILLVFDFTNWEKDWELVSEEWNDIRNNLAVLRASIPDFKELWHDVRYAIFLKDSVLLNSSLGALRESLTKIILMRKKEECNRYTTLLSCEIKNFSSELSDLLEGISDLEEYDVKLLLPPNISYTLRKFAELAKELEQTINSKISSK